MALAILTWFVFLIVLLIIKKQKWGLGLAIAPTLGLAITLCCNTICLLAEIWIGTVLLSSILYIYSCIFTKREKGMKVHRKVRLYEKN